MCIATLDLSHPWKMTCCSCCWTQTSARSKHCTKQTAIIWSGTWGVSLQQLNISRPKCWFWDWSPHVCAGQAANKKSPIQMAVLLGILGNSMLGCASGSQVLHHPRKCDMHKIAKLHKILKPGGLRFILIYFISCKQLSTFHERCIFLSVSDWRPCIHL